MIAKNFTKFKKHVLENLEDFDKLQLLNQQKKNKLHWLHYIRFQSKISQYTNFNQNRTSLYLLFFLLNCFVCFFRWAFFSSGFHICVKDYSIVQFLLSLKKQNNNISLSGFLVCAIIFVNYAKLTKHGKMRLINYSWQMW